MNSRGKIHTCDDFKKFLRASAQLNSPSVMVHASLSKLGYFVNGTEDVVDALFDFVGSEGTVLMPAHSGQLTDPADWRSPPVPSEWVETVRANMKPFHSKTPIRNRGTLADYFLSLKGTLRSTHPISSVSAHGKLAEHFVSDHPLDESEGRGSPYERLAEADGYILLLGVGLENCTGLHYAEFVADCPYLYDASVKVLLPDNFGRNQFVRLKKYPGSSALFPKLEDDLLRSGTMKILNWFDSSLRLIRFKPMIDLAVQKLRADPLFFRHD